MRSLTLDHDAACSEGRRSKKQSRIVAEPILLFGYPQNALVDTPICIGVMEGGDSNNSVGHRYNNSRHPLGCTSAANGMNTSLLHRLSRVFHVVNKGRNIVIDSDKKRPRTVDVRDR